MKLDDVDVGGRRLHVALGVAALLVAFYLVHKITEEQIMSL